MLLILRAAIAVLAISLGGTLLVRALGFEVDPGPLTGPGSPRTFRVGPVYL